MAIDKKYTLPKIEDARVFVFGYIDDMTTKKRITDDLKSQGWKGGKVFDGETELGDKCKYAVYTDTGIVDLQQWTHPMGEEIIRSGMVIILFDPTQKIWSIGTETNRSTDSWFPAPYNPATARKRINAMAKTVATTQNMATGRKVGIYLEFDKNDLVVTPTKTGRVSGSASTNIKQAKAGGWSVFEAGSYAYASKLANQTEVDEFDKGNLLALLMNLSSGVYNNSNSLYIVVIDYDKLEYHTYDRGAGIGDSGSIDPNKTIPTTVTGETIEFNYDKLGRTDGLLKYLNLPLVGGKFSGVSYIDCKLSGITGNGYQAPLFESCHFKNCRLEFADSLRFAGTSSVIDCENIGDKKKMYRVEIYGDMKWENTEASSISIKKSGNIELSGIECSCTFFISTDKPVTVKKSLFGGDVSCGGAVTFEECRHQTASLTISNDMNQVSTFLKCRFPQNGEVSLSGGNIKLIGDMNGCVFSVKTDTPRIDALEATNGIFRLQRANRRVSVQNHVIMPKIDRFIFTNIGTKYPVDMEDQLFIIIFRGVMNEYRFYGESTDSVIDTMSDKFQLVGDIQFPIDEDDFENLDITEAWRIFRGRATSPITNQIPVNPPKDIPTLIKWVGAFGKFCRIFRYNGNGG